MSSRFKVYDTIETVTTVNIRFLLHIGGKSVAIQTHIPTGAIGRIQHVFEDATLLVSFSSNLQERHILRTNQVKPYAGPVPGELMIPPKVDYEIPK